MVIADTFAGRGIWLWCALFCCTSFSGYGQSQPKCGLTLAASGVKGTKGFVGFAIFSSETGWPNNYELAFQHDAVPAKDGLVELKMKSFAAGRFAVVTLHDENANKKLDKKPSGKPKEGWGMSRDPKAVLKTPKFASAALDLKCGDRVQMQMRYPGKEEAK